jgi:hypothetical protein
MSGPAIARIGRPVPIRCASIAARSSGSPTRPPPAETTTRRSRSRDRVRPTTKPV